MVDFSVILSALLSIFILFYVYCVNKRPANFPPGPRWLPFVGNSPLIKRLSIIHRGFHNALVSLSQEYKTKIIGLKLGAELFVVVFSKDLARQVSTQDVFQARPDNFFIRLRAMGSRKGITMTDGDFWVEQRNFAVRQLRSLGFGKAHMESLIIEELQDLVKMLGSEGNNVSLDSYLAPCVLNVLWALTAGSRFPPADPQLTRLLSLMGQRSKAFDMAGGILSQLPFLAYLAPEWSGYKLICSLNQELKSLLEKTIQEHKQSLDASKTRDFIDAFLNKIEDSKGQITTFTEDQLVMVCLDFFIAGSQTTSNTLSFALMNMILYPNVQEQVYDEIKEVLGNRQFPSLEDRSRLPFVEAVLLESQRFSNVVPVAGIRRVLYDTVLDKYNIPKNTTILLSLQALQNDEEVWKQPKTFWPQRFLNENNKKLRDEELFNFGLGKRRCLGEALAKNFLFLFFTGIMRNFRLTVPEGLDPPNPEPIPGITLSPKPYSVQLTKRN